ncbi:MAG: DUF368 domain-containing protein, partial [Clostridia bacterium]|nr:DUF368 domain-containing protein [Clostridia bacterium]
AFITGIYDEFVGSIAKVDSEAVKLLFKGKIRDLWKHINGWFLLSPSARSSLRSAAASRTTASSRPFRSAVLRAAV